MNKNLVYIFAISMLGLVLYQFRTISNLKTKQENIEKKQEQPKIDNQFNTEKMPDFNTFKESRNESAKLEEQKLLNQLQHKMEADSKNSVEHFQNVAKLKFEIPNMNFSQIDSSLEGTEGLYGVAKSGKVKIAILATNQPYSFDQIKNFIENDKEEIPNLKGKNVTWDNQLQEFPAPESSGVHEARVLNGVANGEHFAAVVLERKDGKGRYLFVVSSPNPNFLENEGYFEELFKKLKAE